MDTVSKTLPQLLKEGNVETVQRFLEEDTDPAELNCQDLQTGNTPLHFALSSKREEGVALRFIEKGADIRICNREGRSAFDFAVRFGAVDVVKYLLERQTEKCNECLRLVDADEQTAMHAAAWQKNPEIVRLLVTQNVNVNAGTAKNYRPLHFAAQLGHIEVARVLVNNGALVDVKTSSEDGQNSYSPRKRAIIYGQLETALFLTEKSLKRQRGLISSHHPEMSHLIKGDIALYEGRLEVAAQCYGSVLQRAYENPSQILLRIYCLKKLGHLSVTKGKQQIQEYVNAARWFNNALVLYEQLPRAPREETYLKKLQSCLEQVEFCYCQEVLHGGMSLISSASILTKRAFVSQMKNEVKTKMQHRSAPKEIFKKITQAVKELTHEIIRECLSILGTPPCKDTTYAIVGLDTMSRGEMNLYSEVVLGVLFQDERMAELHRKYFEQLIGLCRIKLFHSGVMGCAPMNHKPEGDFVISGFKETVCFLYGNAQIVKNYKDKRAEYFCRSQESLEWLKSNLLPHTIEWEEEAKKGFFEIEKQIYRPFVEFIQNISLYFGMKEHNTWDCLRKFKDKRIISPKGYQRLHEIFALASLLRLHVHTHYDRAEDRVYCVYPPLNIDLPKERQHIIPFVLSNRRAIGKFFNRYKRFLSLQKDLITFCETRSFSVDAFSTEEFGVEDPIIFQWLQCSKRTFCLEIARIYADDLRVLMALGDQFAADREYRDALDIYKQAFQQMKCESGEILTVDFRKVFVVIQRVLWDIREMEDNQNEAYFVDTLESVIETCVYLPDEEKQSRVLKQVLEITGEKIEEEGRRVAVIKQVIESGSSMNNALQVTGILVEALAILRRRSSDSVENNVMRSSVFCYIMKVCEQLPAAMPVLDLALTVTAEIPRNIFRVNALVAVTRAFSRLFPVREGEEAKERFDRIVQLMEGMKEDEICTDALLQVRNFLQ